MKEVLILRGLPASGKSSFAKELVEKNPNVWKRINMDDLRVMLDNKLVLSKDAEKFMKKMRDVLILETLKYGKNVVSDNTHLSDSSVEHIRQLVEKFNSENFKDRKDYYKVTEKWFHTSPEECIIRDLKRPNSVGSKVIMKMYEDFLAPKITALIQDKRLPHAYLCDIDGTVAKMNGRGAFEWARVGEDSPKSEILNIVKVLKNAGYQIIFFSGRDSVCMAETKEWLDKHFGLDYLIFMRGAGDNRKDSIVKKEMFDKYIRDKFYIEAVFDDRNQVVDTWRKEIGLTCLQVDYGAF